MKILEQTGQLQDRDKQAWRTTHCMENLLLEEYNYGKRIFLVIHEEKFNA